MAILSEPVRINKGKSLINGRYDSALEAVCIILDFPNHRTFFSVIWSLVQFENEKTGIIKESLKNDAFETAKEERLYKLLSFPVIISILTQEIISTHKTSCTSIGSNINQSKEKKLYQYNTFSAWCQYQR
jgi:hypothetical protein